MELDCESTTVWLFHILWKKCYLWQLSLIASHLLSTPVQTIMIVLSMLPSSTRMTFQYNKSGRTQKVSSHF